MAEPAKIPVAPGDVLAGKYRVERLLGSGGMGVVVAAIHLELGQRVAVKFLLPDLVRHAEASVRFLREARAAVKIQSEHVARVIDVGRLENGAPYMVMEYLEGRDLAGVLQDRRPVRVESAVQYVLEACEAIAEAHASGIVHRDLKPSNLFLALRSDGTESIKVLDFGISKLVVENDGSFQPGLTSTSALMGSPLYMSPEQMKSARGVDARTDIWALGAILYELLAGFPPFNGESMPAICAAILIEEPKPLVQIRSDVPPELQAVVARCLAKIPDYRFPHVGELAAALLPFAPRRSRASFDKIARFAGMTQLAPSSDVPAVAPVAPKETVPDIAATRPSAPSEPVPLARRSSRPPPASAPPGSATAASWEEERPPIKRSRGLLAGALVGALAGLGALAVVVVVMIRAKDDPAPSATADPAQPAAAELPAVEAPRTPLAASAAAPAPAPEESSAPAVSASAAPVRTPQQPPQRRPARPPEAKPAASTEVKPAAEPSPMAPPPAAAKPSPKSPIHIEIK